MRHARKLKCQFVTTGCIGVAVVLAVMGTACRDARSAAEFVRQGDEEIARITVESRLYRDHCPSPDGKSLWYVSTTMKGRRLHRLHLDTLREEVMYPELEVGRAYGWSADNRWLAFTVLGERVKYSDYRQTVEFPQIEHLVLYDREADTLIRTNVDSPVIEADASWMDSRTLLFTRYDCTNATRTNLFLDVLTGRSRPVAGPHVALVGIDSNRFCYSDGLNVFLRTLAPAATNRISKFRKGDYDAPRWLRFHAANDSFLFCARPKGSDSRFLCRLARTNGSVRLVSSVDTYNGQWLHAGEGMAYVANEQNRFGLAVHPDEADAATNLFLRGGVDNYTASQVAPSIYCTAAMGDEPLSLWEYKYQTRELRKLTGAPMADAGKQALPVIEFQLPRADGTFIPCYRVDPPKDQPVRGVIVQVPAQSGQFKRLWEPEAQLLAKLGYLYVVANYRGCDGYGKAYASSNQEAGMEDVLTLQRFLASQLGSTPRPFYLFSQSGGASIAESIFNAQPEMWRGAVFKQSGSGSLKSGVDHSRARVLILMGDQDRSYETTKSQAKAAEKNGSLVKFVSLAGAGHTITYYPNAFAEQERQIVRFLADDL